MIGQIFRHRVLLGSILIVAIAAIIIERALNDLVLDHLSPWAVMGLGILVFASAWVFTVKKPTVPFWALVGMGALMLLYGGGV